MTTAKPAGEPRIEIEDWPISATNEVLRLGGEIRKLRDQINAAETRAAKPAGEPRPPRWTIEYGYRIYDAGEYAAEARCPVVAVTMVNALNAAETRAAQPGTPDALRTEIEELLEEIAGRAIDGNYAAPAREAYRTRGKSLAALLASRSTPAAPAPASTEAPGAPSDLYADGFRKGVETLESIIKASLPTFDSNRVAATLEPALVKAAPSTEALIAAGDARERPICKWCVEDASPPEWSAHAKVWIHRRERLDKQCLNPPTALAERLRESTWWRRLTFHHQESYFAIEGDKRIASLRAALAELERPRDLPSV